MSKRESLFSARNERLQKRAQEVLQRPHLYGASTVTELALAVVDLVGETDRLQKEVEWWMRKVADPSDLPVNQGGNRMGTWGDL